MIRKEKINERIKIEQGTKFKTNLRFNKIFYNQTQPLLCS